jgi:hypothetical protein
MSFRSLRPGALLAALLAAAGAEARDPADCTGLVPAALPAPVDLVVGDSSKILCSDPAVDGGGAILIGRIFIGGQGAGDQLYFTRGGAQVGTTALSGLVSAAEEPSGFLALSSESSQNFQHFTNLVRGLSPDGKVLGTTTVFDGPYKSYEQHQFVPDPRGGGAVLDAELAPGASPGDESPWVLKVRRVSTTGETTAGPIAIASGPRLVPQVAPIFSASGDLAVFAGGAHFPGLRNNQLAARWFDPLGAARTPWFLAFDQVDAEHQAAPDVAGALPDGTIAALRLLRGASLHPGSTAVGDAPDWLPATGAALVVLADRIAVVQQHDSPCSSEIEIRAPAGNRCGSIAIPSGTLGNLCLNQLSLHIGRDGTVIRSSPGADGNRCAYRAWPHLLH